MSLGLRTVLITGAGGFVGRHLSASLAPRRGIRVVCAGLPEADDGVEPLDVTSPASVRETLERVRPTDIVHLAGVTSTGIAEGDPDHASEVNVTGVANIAEAVLERLPDCRLISISSSEVYGRSFAAGRAVDENAPLAPITTYARTKAAGEAILERLCGEGLRAIRLRPFNHFGPGQRPEFVIASFASQIARIECGVQPPEIQVGDLTRRRDFLDVRDVVSAYIGVLDHFDSLPNGAVFNVASGEAVSLSTILDRLIGMSTVKINVHAEAARMRKDEVPVACGDASALKRAIGWKPVRDLATSLRETLDYFRASLR